MNIEKIESIQKKIKKLFYRSMCCLFSTLGCWIAMVIIKDKIVIESILLGGVCISYASYFWLHSIWKKKSKRLMTYLVNKVSNDLYRVSGLLLNERVLIPLDDKVHRHVTEIRLKKLK